MYHRHLTPALNPASRGGRTPSLGLPALPRVAQLPLGRHLLGDACHLAVGHTERPHPASQKRMEDPQLESHLCCRVVHPRPFQTPPFNILEGSDL